MSTQKNLLQEIADCLLRASPVGSAPLAMGGAIAVLSSLMGGRYYRPQLSLVRSYEASQEPKLVNQSVTLHGPSGSCKGNTIEAVYRLLKAVDPGYPIVRPMDSNSRSPDALWVAAAEEPPFWIIEHDDHHRWASQEPELASKPNVFKRVTKALLTETVGPDMVARPYSSKKPGTPHYIRQAPITVLTETNPMAFSKKVPQLMAESPFYGEMLVVSHNGERIRKGCIGPDDESLLSQLKPLREARREAAPVYVEIPEDVRKFYRGLLKVAMEESDHTAIALLKTQVLNVAAIFAVGRDYKKPAVTMRDISRATRLALTSAKLARGGLQGVEVHSSLEQLLMLGERVDGPSEG